MDKYIIDKAIKFINECDIDFKNNIYLSEKAVIADNILSSLSFIQISESTNYLMAITEKLQFIINTINANNYHEYDIETMLNLASLSVTDYIISLVKEKYLTDPLLIIRYVYIELSKVLYYDISYVKQTNIREKRIICDAKVDLQKEKIFSYVVCTQWLELYTYILKQFDIVVSKKQIEGQDHVWGEIKLNENDIVIVDATDYIDSSIDLSNAKSLNPTVGFVVLPKKYSGIKLYDVFNNQENKEIAQKVKEYYSINRSLDNTLGYIKKNTYKSEKTIRENELFNYPTKIITDSKELEKYTYLAIEFFQNYPIPKNIDGYEIYAFYYRFIKNLPLNIKANISQKTLFVDSYNYKQRKLKKKFLTAPSDYLKYLQKLVYSRYYKYLSVDENLKEEEKNKLFKDIGQFDGDSISKSILEYEMKIADINRNLNSYYAINKLQFYDPCSSMPLKIQLYEPMMGSKILSDDEYDKFKIKNSI